MQPRVLHRDTRLTGKQSYQADRIVAEVVGFGNFDVEHADHRVSHYQGKRQFAADAFSGFKVARLRGYIRNIKWSLMLGCPSGHTLFADLDTAVRVGVLVVTVLRANVKLIRGAAHQHHGAVRDPKVISNDEQDVMQDGIQVHAGKDHL